MTSRNDKARVQTGATNTSNAYENALAYRGAVPIAGQLRIGLRGKNCCQPLDEFLTDLAHGFGVHALVDRSGAFLISPDVLVCYHDDLHRGLETGWSAVRLPAVDGRARLEDRRGPRILVGPKGRCLLWQPFGGPRQQRRITLPELVEMFAEMGAREATLASWRST